MLVYLFLIIGFIFLIKSAQILVDGAIAIAKKLNVSPLVVGLTIVAFGTSLPELILNITANLKGAGDLALGNIIGSNINDILIVIGLAALIQPIKIRAGVAYKEIALGFLAIVALFLLANNLFLNGSGATFIGRVDGLLLIMLFSSFIYYVIGLAKNHQGEWPAHDAKSYQAIIYIFLGVAGLAMGGYFVISSALAIADKFGLSQSLIGLTILSIGTTLPEIITSLVAAIKKNADLAIGNIIGSVVFNALFIVGLSALIKPLAYNDRLNADFMVSAGATLILFWFMFNGKKEKNVSRWEGFGLLYLYAIYFIYLVWRG